MTHQPGDPLAPAGPRPAQMYVYQMVQMSTALQVAPDNKGNELAQMLQTLVNDMARQGWEFWRVDTFTMVVSPGCLASLLGARSEVGARHVVTFRRPA